MALPALLQRPSHAPEQASAAALAALYRACHLPPPAMLVAQDAIHFALLTDALTRTVKPDRFFRVATMIALLIVLVLDLQGGEIGSIGALLAAYISVMMTLTLLPIGPRWARLSDCFRRVGGRAALIMLAAGVTAWLDGRGIAAAQISLGAVMALVAIGFHAGDLISPVWWRSILYAQAHGTAPRAVWSRLFGFQPMSATIHERLQSALADVATLGRPQASSDHDEARPQRWNALRRQLSRFWVPSEAMPILGHNVGYSYDLAGQVSALAISDEDPSDLPQLLRSAIQLDVMADAICPLSGIAIVLFSGATASPIVPPVDAQHRRRSQRHPWATALHWLDEPGLGLIMALDLAPSDAIADALLARRIERLADPAQRTPALQALGADRAAVALRIRPVQSDAYGRLFQFGPPVAASVFVAVHDRVLDADGAALEHWISVPPHMATAKEAIAWTFQMSEQSYGPTQET